jgi:phosphoglycerol transferase MdoB-like AlkP superfamily enzyme
MTQDGSPILNQSLTALGKDPRYQLISAWVGIIFSPFFLFTFWVLARTMSPWFWVLVAASVFLFGYIIWLAVKYRRAFSRAADERLHAD